MGKVWIGAPSAREAPQSGACSHGARAVIPAFRAGNLPSRISERDVEYEFKPFGRIMSVWVARKPPGFGASVLQTPTLSVLAQACTLAACAGASAP